MKQQRLPPRGTAPRLQGGTAVLEEQIRVLESVIENMGDGVAVANERGDFLVFNSAAKRIYGSGPVDGALEHWSEIFGVFRTDGVTPYPVDQLPLARALAGDSTEQVELFIRNPAHPDGIFVASTGRPLRDAEGRVRGGIVVLRDISSQKEAAALLQASHQRLSRLLADQERFAGQSRVLAEMSSLLQASATVDELHAIIADYLERLFPGVQGAFFAYSASRDDLEQKASWGLFPPDEAQIKRNECWGLRRGRAHVVQGDSARTRCRHVPVADGHDYLCAPVLGPDETVGLLHLRFDRLDQSTDGDAAQLWDERAHVATRSAEYIGLASVNLRLRHALQQQSIRDPLTGLFNRRFLEETLTREIRRAQRKKTGVCLLMVDVDHFKFFNDTYGHAAGDSVLRELGALLKHDTRGSDMASRYGGEEFALILAESTLPDALHRAELLLERIRALQVMFNGSSLGAISASIGVAAYPEHGDQATVLLSAADTALYAAKQAGRDRVEVPPATAASPSSETRR